MLRSNFFNMFKINMFKIDMFKIDMFKMLLVVVTLVSVFVGMGGATLFANHSNGGVLVFPLQVSPQEEVSHLWLGRGLSFYLTAGLAVNGVPVVPDETVAKELRKHHIFYPFVISKATAIKLGRKMKAETVVLGTILAEPETPDVLKINVAVIRLADLSQKHLPLMEVKLSYLLDVKEELLRRVVKEASGDRPEVIEKKVDGKKVDGKKVDGREKISYPPINLELQQYEIFIKSLLLDDVSERIEMLRPVADQVDDSDFLNYLLACCYLESGELTEANVFLERVSNTPLFHEKKQDLAKRLETSTE